MSRALLVLAACGAAALAVGATPLAAQQVVGHLPSQSPFRDIEPSQQFTLESGYFKTQQDEIGATPRSGPFFGVRYDIPVGGPARFYVRLDRVSSHRQAFDPTKPPATRDLGRVSSPLWLGDLGFALDLTGERTWHGIIPTFDAGLGIATGSHTTKSDPYSFGTQFALRSDFGIRIHPSNGLELRLLAGPTMYQNHYPSGYFVAPVTSTGASAGPALLGTGTARSGFRTNWAYTAGLAFPLFR
jgi:hypothetical protein